MNTTLTPDPARLALIQSAGRVLPLDEVARRVSEASGLHPTLFVERRDNGYLWSPAVKGGPYPLLRTIAKLLELPHTSLIVGGRAAGDYCVFNGEIDIDDEPEVWTVLTFDGPATVEHVTAQIAEELGS